MKKFIKENLNLFFLIIICILYILFAIMNIQIGLYILILAILGVIIFCKEAEAIPLILFIHPNSALFDNIGFTYLFNITIALVAIKMLFFFKYKLPRNSLLLFLILLFMEIILCLFSGMIDFKIFSLISWISSYLVLILVSFNHEKIDFKKIYRYFFIGFCFSFIIGWFNPIMKWGINIPTGYRFTGLLRDPNYYSIDVLFLIFSSSVYAKICKKNKFIYIIPLTFMGFCSVSKTFVILLFIGIFISIILNIKKIKFKNFILGFIIITIAILFAYNYGLIDLIMDKYLYRSETTDLLTGRDKLWKFYISSLFKNPFTLLFGNSLTYYSKILNPGIIDSFFTNFVAHNTYLDIVLGWGILGILIYMYMLSNIFNGFKIYYNKFLIKEKNPNFYTCTIIFLAVLFVLSYLSADVFAILLLYLFVLKFALYKKDGENLNEKN